MGEIEIRNLAHRQWAHPFDHSVQYEGPTRGHDYSPEAIGGCYGMAWDMVFRDRKNGELYAVNCYDGVNRSKSPHRPDDEEWMQRVQDQMIVRTRRDAQSGATQVCLSREEWAVMSGRMFHDWFDPLPNEQGTRLKSLGDWHRYQTEGHVGTINGVSVVVDPKCPSPLGDTPTDVKTSLALELARIDEAEDLAESLGY